MALGDNIKIIRTEKKLTQKELAEKMGISRSYLSDIENNRKNPSKKTIDSLAEKLNVTMLYLTTGKKAYADLTDDEKNEAAKTMNEHFKENAKKKSEYVKKKMKRVQDSDLDIVEVTYLTNMLNFLERASTHDKMSMAAIMITLVRAAEYKQDESTNKEDLNEFLKGELDDITKFFHDYFFNDNKEGD